MPLRLNACALFAVCVLFVSGCGTVANTLWLNDDEGGMRVYGGVRGDWEIIHESSTGSPGTRMDSYSVLLGSLDIPFSAIGDTVTLPLTIPYSILSSTRRPRLAEPTQ
jgi:uncharacterized protein YceK